MSKALKIDIDKIAREASKPDNEYTPDPNDLPVVPGLWHILVQPLTPKNVSAGGIQLADETQEAQEILTSLGRIIAHGPLAFSGKTESGMDTSQCVVDPETGLVRPYQDGDWIYYMRYTGHSVTLDPAVTKTKRLHTLLFLTVSEIVGLVRRPRDFRIYV